MLTIISTIVGEERELAGLVYRIMIVQTLHGKPLATYLRKPQIPIASLLPLTNLLCGRICEQENQRLMFKICGWVSLALARVDSPKYLFTADACRLQVGELVGDSGPHVKA